MGKRTAEVITCEARRGEKYEVSVILVTPITDTSGH